MRDDLLTPLIQALSALVRGFRAADAATNLTPSRHGDLATAAEALPEFGVIVAELMTLARYAARIMTTEIRVNDCASELGAFLRRSGVYSAVWRGENADARALVREFEAEVAKDTCDVTRLIPIDGLSIEGNAPIQLAGCRLVKFDKAQWGAFFEAERFPSPDLGPLSNLWAIELRSVEAMEPNPLLLWTEPPVRRIERLVGNWICYINAWSPECVRPIAIYTRADSRLGLPPVEEASIGAPTWINRIDPESGDEYEEPFVPVPVGSNERAAFGDFLCELERGRIAAAHYGPRVATSLHWFFRIGERSARADGREESA